MSIVEELGKEALLQALTARRETVQQEYFVEPDGSQTKHNTVVPAPSIAQTILATYLKNHQEEADAIVSIALAHIKKNPQNLAELLSEKMIAWASEGQDVYSSRLKPGKQALVDSIRDSAAELLKGDSNFRERVLDMASRSDSDRIDVNISLKPGGGNA